jgi:hypothetical protein
MKALGLASLFMPEGMLLPLLTLAGLFLVFGLRKLAGSIVTLVVVMAFSPMFEPMFDALFAAMPWWFPMAFIAGLVVMFAGRFLRDVFVQVIGDLIASGIKLILGSPFALLALFTAMGVFWMSMN